MHRQNDHITPFDRDIFATCRGMKDTHTAVNKRLHVHIRFVQIHQTAVVKGCVLNGIERV